MSTHAHNPGDVREAWLLKAAGLLRSQHFAPRGYTVPDTIRLSVGFPRGGRKGNHAIGQCWVPDVSADQHHEIFISPELAEPNRVLDVMIHELVHATVGVRLGHKKEFKLCALAMGLEGKMTATTASAALTATLQTYLAALPPYPHAALTPIAGGRGLPKQSTRMLKLTCINGACGYTVRTSAKWIEVGLPACPCGGVLQPENQDE